MSKVVKLLKRLLSSGEVFSAEGRRGAFETTWWDGKEVKSDRSADVDVAYHKFLLLVQSTEGHTMDRIAAAVTAPSGKLLMLGVRYLGEWVLVRFMYDLEDDSRWMIQFPSGDLIYDTEREAMQRFSELVSELYKRRVPTSSEEEDYMREVADFLRGLLSGDPTSGTGLDRYEYAIFWWDGKRLRSVYAADQSAADEVFQAIIKSPGSQGTDTAAVVELSPPGEMTQLGVRYGDQWAYASRSHKGASEGKWVICGSGRPLSYHSSKRDALDTLRSISFCLSDLYRSQQMKK